LHIQKIIIIIIKAECKEHLFGEIMAEISLNVGKDMDNQIQEGLRTPSRPGQKRTLHII
jgi:hypothetical protein